MARTCHGLVPSGSRLAVMLLVGLLMAGCSDSSGDDRASGVADRSGAEAAVPSTDAEGPGATATPPSISLSELGLDDEQRACVEAELGDLSDPAAVDRQRARDAMAVCVRAETFGPAFSAGIAAAYPGVYDEDQLVCLDVEYSLLPADDYDLLIAVALEPDHPDERRAQEIARTLYEACDAPLPPDL